MKARWLIALGAAALTTMALAVLVIASVRALWPLLPRALEIPPAMWAAINVLLVGATLFVFAVRRALQNLRASRGMHNPFGFFGRIYYPEANRPSHGRRIFAK